MATAAEIQTAYKAFYRVDLNATVAASIASSGVSLDNYIASLNAQTASTTSAAVAIASFVTGLAPTSAKLDSLKVEADKQVASYTALGVANPELGAFEAFGRSFATDADTTAAFAAKYGSLSTADFIGVVYGSVYGATPSTAALANLTGQIEYFTKLYTDNNVPNAALAAKGAVLGQIVGYAFTSDAANNSSFDNQVSTLLSNIAKGDTAGYGKALPAAVNPGQEGVSIKLIAPTNEVSPTSLDPLYKSTANNDTISGTLKDAGATIASATSINAAAGDDTLKLTIETAAGNLTYAPADKLVSVESIFVTTTAAAGKVATVDLNNVVGVNAIWLDAGSTGATADVVFKDVGATTAIGLKASAAGLTIDYKADDTAVANITVDGLATGKVAFADATVKTVNVATSSKANQVGFGDNDLQTVKISGTGSVTISDVGTGLKSFDASGAGGIVKADFIGENFTNKGTFVLGASSDTFKVDAVKAHTITLGAGNDTAELKVAGANSLTDISTAAKIATDVVTITDFLTGGQLDSLRLDATQIVRTTLTQTTLDEAAGGDLKAALTAVGNVTKTAADDTWAFFSNGGDTYAYYDVAHNGLDLNDAVIKLSGVSLADLSFTGATQNVFLV